MRLVQVGIRCLSGPQLRQVENHGHRRMGVALALGSSIEDARSKARAMTQMLLEGVRLD